MPGRPSHRLPARAALLLVALAAGGARAEGRADLQQLHPSATSSGWLGLDGPAVLPHLRGAVGLFLSEGEDALVLRDPSGAVVPTGHLVAHQLWLEAIGSVGLFERFELGLAVPIALTQTGDEDHTATDPAGALRGERGAALGDLRLDGKILLLERRLGSARAPHQLRLALIVGLTLRTATADLAGDEGASGRPRLAFEWAHRRLRLLIESGAVLRARARLLDLDVTHQITWGLGARVRVWRGLEVLAEARGAVGVGLPNGRSLDAAEAPAELDAGVAYAWPLGLTGFAAGGVGLGHGYGVPVGRVVVGARFVIPEQRADLPWAERDDDGDGVLNVEDRCVREPGPAENGGCPDYDTDGDGVLDRSDRCPARVGLRENAGCPDYDTDGDNIPDRLDRCPKEPGPIALAGCPPKDADHDGVPDATDRCPDRPGVAENDGCPDVDSDGDGLVDRLDKCPFDPEVYNGVSDEDGCPDEGVALAALAAGQIAVFEPIAFERDAEGERLTARALQVVAAVAGLLRAHGEVTRVRVDGHTDNRGDAVDNLDLSLQHAQLVRRVLVEKHRIDPKRVAAQGFGGNRPVADNATPQGRARNRRIEITLVEEAP